MGKEAAFDIAGAAVSLGIGSAATDLFGQSLSWGKAAFEAGMHGVTGGLMSQLQGGNFGSGLFSGMVSSAVASGVCGLGATGAFSGPNGRELYEVATVALGGLSGGLSSTIAGGSFWDGFKQGVIVSALNHLVHDVVELLQKNGKLYFLLNETKWTHI